MTTTMVHLVSLSSQIILLGGIAWLQLYLLRRAPASSRSRLCSLALIAILLLAAAETLAPSWTVKAPVYTFIAVSAPAASLATRTAPDSWLVFAWFGTALLLSRAVVGRTALAILRRSSTHLERTDGIDVRIAKVQTPILAGLARPVILLPEAAAAWTEEQRHMVLTHELTHFRQGDCWTNLLAQILRAAFWFHPAVWLLVSRLSREQELTCDEAVVASGHSPQNYAAFLLDTVRHLKSRDVFACAMAGSGARSLKQRFANLLEFGPRPRLTRRIAVCVALFILAAAALTLVHPVWSPRTVLAQRPVTSQGPRSAATDGSENARPDEVYKVGGDVTHPMVLTKIDPPYTQAARAAKISGTAHVRLIVTAEGKPDSIEVTDGVGYGLDESAIDAISQWTFQPATKDGKPVAVWANVEVNFKLL